jgi:MFS transporter, DHA1 family, staphyloferrin A biosynthesis exporter
LIAYRRFSPRLPDSLASLQHRNYRLLWFGNLISQSGDWMDQVAFSWLIYEMTHSTVSLALINVCRAGPILLFTLIGGVIADRVERRRLLFVTQFILMVLAFILAGLITAGLLQVWMAFVIATARGVTNSFNQPARQSLISELVPPEDLPNAIALNSATLNMTRVIGPATGGILIATIGVAGAFYINAVTFIAVLYGLAIMQFPQRVANAKQGGMLNDLVAGIAYLRRETALRTLVILALVPMVLGQPYQTMLTVFSKDVFHSGSTGLGLMQAVAALGALTGALMFASARDSRHFNEKMLLGLIGFGAGLLIFCLMPSLWLAVIPLFLSGVFMQTYQVSNNTLLQLKVDPEYRGRVLSTLFLQRGMVPVGTMLAGVLATAVGPQIALGGMALALVLIGILAFPYALPILNRLRDRPDAMARPRRETPPRDVSHLREPRPVSLNDPAYRN